MSPNHGFLAILSQTLIKGECALLIPLIWSPKPDSELYTVALSPTQHSTWLSMTAFHFVRLELDCLLPPMPSMSGTDLDQWHLSRKELNQQPTMEREERLTGDIPRAPQIRAVHCQADIWGRALSGCCQRETSGAVGLCSGWASFATQN